MGKTLQSVIRDTRKKMSLTLRDVERLSKKRISNAYINRIENGHEKIISPDILRVLSIVLKLNYVNLLILGGHLTLREAMEFNLHNSRKGRKQHP